MSDATTVTRLDIVNGLRALGVGAGDVVLAHSSLKSFGIVEGGVEAVIDALLESVGPAGTVMAPTITGTAEHSPSHPPLFDVRETPCWTGAIPEALRKRPGAVRSLHPTHSVAAIGPHAEFLTRDHLACGSPCGPNSPYLRLAELDGKVVFFGVDLSRCTLLHGVEELADCRYHMQPDPVPATVIDANGAAHRVEARIHLWGTPRRFPIIEPLLLERGALRIGRIGNAPVRVLRARPTVDIVADILRQDPRYLCA